MLNKPLVWLAGEIKTPPFSTSSRVEAGVLPRRLQRGEKLSLPQSRAMPGIARACHELRINDLGKRWRIIYRIDSDAIVIGEVFQKTSPKTPARVIRSCRNRYRAYDALIEDSE
jgi:phage-related protein